MKKISNKLEISLFIIVNLKFERKSLEKNLEVLFWRER